MIRFLIIPIIFLAVSCSSADEHADKQPNETPNALDVSAIASTRASGTHYFYESRFINLTTFTMTDQVAKDKIINDGSKKPTFVSAQETLDIGDFTYGVALDNGLNIQNNTSGDLQTITQPSDTCSYPHYTPSQRNVLIKHQDALIYMIEFDTSYIFYRYAGDREMWRTEIEHTHIDRSELNTYNYQPYLGLNHFGKDEMIFTGEHPASGNGVTRILNLEDGTVKELDVSVSGVVLGPSRNVRALLSFQPDVEETFDVFDLNGNKVQTYDNGTSYYKKTMKAMLVGDQLIVANYSAISTGCLTRAYDYKNGELLWKVYSPPVTAGHSQYSNHVEMTSFENLILIHGTEAHGNYLQSINIKTGEVEFQLAPSMDEPAS